jgi:hypothetical protein
MSMPVNPFRKVSGSAQLSRKQHGGREIESLLAMNKRTEKTERISQGWRCSCCGDLITSIEDGWVEWLASEDERGERLKGLRLVHRLSPSAESNGPGCRYDSVREFRNDRSIVEGLSLERFVGSDGLMLLLSFLASGEMPCGDVLELAKRVQIPGYEQARELFPEAIGMGVLSPTIGKGYYMQSEIRELLSWVNRETNS